MIDKDHSCDKEVAIDMMREDLREIKSDVKLLLAERNRRDGIMYIVSGVIAMIVSLGSKFL